MPFRSNIREEVLVYSSADIVWELLTDPEKFLLWWSGPTLSGEYKRLDDTTFRMTREHSPLAGTLTGKIITSIAEQKLEWRATETSGPFTEMNETWEIEDARGGLIKVIFQNSYTLGLPGLIGRTYNFLKLRPALRQMWRGELRNLKYAAEVTLADL